MSISIVVAIGRNNQLGYNNHLLWSLPNDMKRFKTLTTGHTVIMGRNTYLSLPKGALPNRRNVVISDDKNDNFPGCEMVSSIKDAIKLTENDGEVFIMGGASIYRQFLQYADRLYLTIVDDSPEADVFFPLISSDDWVLVEREDFTADERHCADYSFRTLERKK
ncbi:MAG: dihydrofolate reductase [Bacteroidales bacterium]|nr:dihydrofolate reductase [Bacteroidales bacterium]